MIRVEVAVESLEAAAAAVAGGADRIELCADLAVGGLTPSAELTERVLAEVAMPVFVMVRPRAGNFVYSRDEIAGMCATVERLIGLGAHGIVTGALTTWHGIDVTGTSALVSSAAGVPVTFHRAFDRAGDQSVALEQLIDVGVTRVLTSGGAPTALEGWPALRALVAQSAGRIVILAGGGVREPNVMDLVMRTGVREVHARLIDGPGEALTAERVERFRMQAKRGSIE